MSGEKIDLAKIAAYELRIIRQIDELAQLGQLSPVKLEMRKDAQDRLALVRAVRETVKFVWTQPLPPSGVVTFALHAALSPFTDSAEVRSDGG